MIRRVVGAVAALALLGFAARGEAQTWNPAKPATGDSLISVDVRSNWTALQQAAGTGNLLADPTFLIWPAGDAAAPAWYLLAGTGAAIARTGTGLADTNRKVDDYAAKITSGAGAQGYLQQSVLTVAGIARASFIKGQAVSCGVWARTASSNAGRVGINDGVGTSYSSYAPATSTWTWLTVTRTIDASATSVTARMTVEGGGLVAYFSGPTCLAGPVPPGYFQPARSTYRQAEACFLAGNCAAAVDKCRWRYLRPILIRDVQIEARTAPATQALITDVETWDGAAWGTLYSAGNRPQIAAAGRRGSAQPDSTYARRGLIGFSGSGIGVGSELRFNIAQCGTGTVGADLVFELRFLAFDPPFASFNDPTQW